MQYNKVTNVILFNVIVIADKEYSNNYEHKPFCAKNNNMFLFYLSWSLLVHFFFKGLQHVGE